MYVRVFKRAIDVLAAAFILLLFLPVIVIVACAVAIFMGRPVLFTQERPGKNGIVFNILKFRSMSNKTDEHNTLLPNEQRITSFGLFLRRSSLDELPGLINVLTGKMSLVGPRPLRVVYLDRYNEYHARRHEVRPGITGLAQVSGRNSLSWQEKLDYDIDYVKNASLLLDVKILLLTIVKVFKHEGIDSKESGVGMAEFKGYSNDGK